MALAPEEARERDDASCERNDDRGAAPAVPRLLDDRQRTRSDERAGRALQRASGDQHVDRRSSGTQQGEQAERGDAGREDATLAVDVAERATDQDQRPQREQIGVRNPLLRRETAA